MKKRLLLITNGYPFGESERGFLTEEVKVLSSQFELYIMALESREELRYPTDGIVHIEQYRFSSLRKSRRFDALPSVFQMASLREAWTCAKRNGFSNPLWNLRRVLYTRFNVWEMEQQIAKLVETRKIDMVYTYWCTECTVAAVSLKKRFPNLKVVTRFHGVDLYEERTEENWQPFRKEIAKKADALCFACDYGRTYFTERWGREYAGKMGVFYLGSPDYGTLTPNTGDALRLVSCSHLVGLKRVELIIKGLASLPDTVKLRWDHFGDGVERQTLEKLAEEELGNCPNIRWEFHGFVPNAALAEEYRKTEPQLFITTSSTEGGAPVSIQEVFSMGVPAIGTPIGGIPDLILDGHTGFLLPQDVGAADVAAAIQKYAELPETDKQEMSKRVRRHWEEKFDAKQNAQRFAAYLQNILLQEESAEL